MPGRLLPALAAAALALGVVACQPKKAMCSSPEIECDGKCVNGLTDPSNCGGCGVTCGAGQTCCGFCTDLATDASDCGACFNRCPGNGGTCSGGACSCPPSVPDACGYVPGVSAGTCVNLQTGDGGQCGTCGHVCAGTGATASCSTGACVCGGGATDCGANPECVNLLVDPTNCGTCGNDCQTHATCAGGSCACSNPSFPDDCGPTGCVNVALDPSNCGTCGHACTGATPACSGGLCCPSGWTSCTGTCKNLASDPSNCGTCGHACGPDQGCAGSACVCLPAKPLACGSLCCLGNACCSGGSACQFQHTNGVGALSGPGGGFFYDCHMAFYTSAETTADLAKQAADAWAPGTDFNGIFCNAQCLARQTATGQCGVWCYGSANPLAGRARTVNSLVCAAACPDTTFAVWQ